MESPLAPAQPVRRAQPKPKRRRRRRKAKQPEPTPLHGAVRDFIRGGTRDRVLVMRDYVGSGVRLYQYQTFVTTALPHRVRDAILTLYQQCWRYVWGDVESLLRKPPLIEDPHDIIIDGKRKRGRRPNCP